MTSSELFVVPLRARLPSARSRTCRGTRPRRAPTAVRSRSRAPIASSAAARAAVTSLPRWWFVRTANARPCSGAKKNSRLLPVRPAAVTDEARAGALRDRPRDADELEGRPDLELRLLHLVERRALENAFAVAHVEARVAQQVAHGRRDPAGGVMRAADAPRPCDGRRPVLVAVVPDGEAPRHHVVRRRRTSSRGRADRARAPAAPPRTACR